jgi:hypothetical protein
VTFPRFVNTVLTSDQPGGNASNVTHGFVRAANGTLTTFDILAPNIFKSTRLTPQARSLDTIPTPTFHGFLRAPDGALTTIDVPGSTGTREARLSTRPAQSRESFSTQPACCTASCSQLSGDPLIFDTYAPKQIEHKKDNRSGWAFLPFAAATEANLRLHNRMSGEAYIRTKPSKKLLA